MNLFLFQNLTRFSQSYTIDDPVKDFPLHFNYAFYVQTVLYIWLDANEIGVEDEKD
jgi:hypothetical protein